MKKSILSLLFTVILLVGINQVSHAQFTSGPGNYKVVVNVDSPMFMPFDVYCTINVYNADGSSGIVETKIKGSDTQMVFIFDETYQGGESFAYFIRGTQGLGYNVPQWYLSYNHRSRISDNEDYITLTWEYGVPPIIIQ